MGMLPFSIYDDVVNESVPDEVRPYLKGAVADLIREAREGS
jgi:hypothetical protein